MMNVIHVDIVQRDVVDSLALHCAAVAGTRVVVSRHAIVHAVVSAQNTAVQDSRLCPRPVCNASFASTVS